MPARPDQSAWRRKAHRRCTRVLICSIALFLLAWAALTWTTRLPTTVKLGTSTASGVIQCLDKDGAAIRLDYDLWLGTNSDSRFPTSTRVQVTAKKTPDPAAEPEGKPTWAAAIRTVQTEFAKLCESHGCPELAPKVDVENGASNLHFTHPEYAHRRRTTEILEFTQAASGITAIAAAIALAITTVQRWNDKRVIPAWCCQRCRYDLRNISGRACPECGGPGLNQA